MVSRRGYPEDVITSEMKKVVFNTNFGICSNKNKGMPFVLTYHLLNMNIKKLKKCFNQDLWYRFEAPETSVAI